MELVGARDRPMPGGRLAPVAARPVAVLAGTAACRSSCGSSQAAGTGKPVVDTGDHPLAVLAPDNIAEAHGQPSNLPLDHRERFKALWLVS